MMLSAFRYLRLPLFILLFQLAGSSAWASESQSIATIDINTASAEEMADALIGVGEQKAIAIVDYRRQNGPFNSLESLSQVKGIGDKTVEKNRSRIRLGK